MCRGPTGGREEQPAPLPEVEVEVGVPTLGVPPLLGVFVSDATPIAADVGEITVLAVEVDSISARFNVGTT
jgi:hypothetical protein